MKIKAIATLLILSTSILAVAQSKIVEPIIQKHLVYNYLINPREYPDDGRRHVKPPAWDLFGNQTHFTALRGLKMKDGKLVNFARDFDMYTKTYDLGDVIWPNSRFLSATNIPDLVREMKQRNLYLFDIWGYVPGSGPGDWHQFELSKETSRLFESELGDRWLGMDMGEQDGRYVLAYAQTMYPASAGRFQQYLNFHKHMEKITNDSDNKMATLVAITYGHYLLKEGLYSLVGAETAQMHPNGQVFYSFNRGAGKQYGVPWFGNASVYNRWGWKSYEDTGKTNGPTKGTSLSLMKRLMYSHILYNSMLAGFESGWTEGGKLSPIGRIQQAAQKWVRKTGSPGVQQTPVALMLDFYAGWIFPNYNNYLYRIWGNLNYGPGDYLTNNVYDLLYPGYQVSSFFHDESGFATATPYGDAADALLSDAPLWLLKRYPVLIVSGELSGGVEVRDKLQKYIEAGGQLFITAGSMKNLPGGLAGIQCEGKPVKFMKGQEVLIYNNKITEKCEFELLPLQVPAGTRTLATVNGQKAVVEMESGTGTIMVFASPFGISSSLMAEKPVLQTVDKPLPNPFPMLDHVRIFLEKALESQKFFDAGKGLSIITCRQKAGEYTVGISNNSWDQLPMNIVSNIGKILSVKELPLDQSEKNAIGYLPEGMEGKIIGKSAKNTIAGGDIRIFHVSVDEEGVQEIPHETPRPNPRNRILPLREAVSIQTEILARPTFFQNFDGVAVDWKYLNQRENKTLEKESTWLRLQKPQIWVDLTSGINLFPDLRLVNNIESEYRNSMATINDVIEKMGIIGSKNLIISLHTTVENNISLEDTWKELDRSVTEICKNAGKLGITVHLRLSAGNRLPRGKTDDAIRLMERVNMPNLKLALNTAVLLDTRVSPQDLAAKLTGKIGVWLVNTPQRDLSDRLWNTYAPVSSSGYEKELAKLLGIAPEIPMMTDVVFENKDQEYIESVVLDDILSMIKPGYHHLPEQPVDSPPDTNSESYPSVVLSNGILDALIFIPDKDNGYYRSVRFDWSGFMAQVTYNGHTFFQDWSELESPMPGIHDPLNTASGTGIAEEFREPLGYENASIGQPFLKIGVGLLEKPWNNAYFFAEPYKILHPGEWKINQGKDWILFEQSISTESGYAYRYSKRISLLPGKPEISVSHVLVNSGTKQIISNTYCHNFFRFDKDDAGTNYTIKFAQAVTPIDSFKDKALISGNTFRLINNLYGKTPVAGAVNVGTKNEFTVTNSKTGTKISVTGDNPLSSFYLYIWQAAMCTEPMITINIKPGQKQEWTNRYHFEIE